MTQKKWKQMETSKGIESVETEVETKPNGFAKGVVSKSLEKAIARLEVRRDRLQQQIDDLKEELDNYEQT